jgi:hypothetical protein
MPYSDHPNNLCLDAVKETIWRHDHLSVRDKSIAACGLRLAREASDPDDPCRNQRYPRLDLRDEGIDFELIVAVLAGDKELNIIVLVDGRIPLGQGLYIQIPLSVFNNRFVGNPEGLSRLERV